MDGTHLAAATGVKSATAVPTASQPLKITPPPITGIGMSFSTITITVTITTSYMMVTSF